MALSGCKLCINSAINIKMLMNQIQILLARCGSLHMILPLHHTTNVICEVYHPKLWPHKRSSLDQILTAAEIQTISPQTLHSSRFFMPLWGSLHCDLSSSKNFDHMKGMMICNKNIETKLMQVIVACWYLLVFFPLGIQGSVRLYQTLSAASSTCLVSIKFIFEV